MNPPAKIRIALLALAAGAFIPGCGEPIAESGSNAHPATYSAPVEILSRSGIRQVWLPGGRFTSRSFGPAREVTLSPFLIDKFEVTQEQFRRAECPDPSRRRDPFLPVHGIRWREAKFYCNERSRLEGLDPCYDEAHPELPCDFSANGYRLPTEAEWEFAAQPSLRQPRLRDWHDSALFAENSDGRLHPPGEKSANGWGVHDLFGNVAEWCEDIYRATPPQTSHNPVALLDGPLTLESRALLRGGSWRTPWGARDEKRHEPAHDADSCARVEDAGFRCVRRPAPGENFAVRD